MSAHFLSGAFSAFAIAQVAYGLFFVLAYALRRREVEYLLFGLVCFGLALDSIGVGWSYVTTQASEWLVASRVAHIGAAPAAALNVHFVLRYAGLPVSRRGLVLLHGTAAAFVLAATLGPWWVPGSVVARQVAFFGAEVAHFSGTPTLMGSLFYLVVVVEVVVAAGCLVVAVKRGRREAGIALGASALVAAAGANDVLVVTGSAPIYLTPIAFLVYACAVGSTLLFRYRSAVGELETAVDSLEHAAHELRTSHAELRVVQDELGKKKQLAAVGELAAMIAHEVRNPIAVIMNAVASLRRPGITIENHQMLLRIVEEEAERLERLVSDLLRFARPVRVVKSRVSLRELVERAASLVSRGHALELDVDDETGAIVADPALLRLVFDNLVSNACQAMPRGGTLTIRTRSAVRGEQAGTAIEIADTGDGMEPDILNRAPDPFFTTRPSGTGLGLPIVERIIDAHGGSLSIRSEVGAGTTVTLFIPAADFDEHTAALEASA